MSSAVNCLLRLARESGLSRMQTWPQGGLLVHAKEYFMFPKAWRGEVDDLGGSILELVSLQPSYCESDRLLVSLLARS
jgi:hypothetical protein